MPNLVALLSERFSERKEKAQKMNELSERSSFSGIFQMPDVTDHDRAELEGLLSSYAHEKQSTGDDFQHLLAITSEIKAINNQAIMLHGERIRRAQSILKKYKDGAFSKWLLTTYGNRQTPYNFLQFYEFYENLDEPMKKVADEIPKQVIYSLSSRSGSPQKKEQFLKQYKGETKQVLLKKLRDTFPLKKEDKRNANLSAHVLSSLRKLKETCTQKGFLPTLSEKKEIKRLLEELQAQLHD